MSIGAVAKQGDSAPAKSHTSSIVPSGRPDLLKFWHHEVHFNKTVLHLDEKTAREWADRTIAAHLDTEAAFGEEF